MSSWRQPIPVAKGNSAKGPRTKKARNRRRLIAERQAHLERTKFWRHRREE